MPGRAPEQLERPCREYQGLRMPFGYGQARIGRPEREGYARKKYTTIHRWVVEQVEGRPLRSDEIVRHKCDNPPCYDHLELGTSSENTRDMFGRGTTSRSKLSVPDIRDIRSSLADGERPRDIAARYGVRTYVIERIRVGRSWSWVV